MKANKNDLHESGRVLSKEEFINKIKTDDEFAKKWGDLGPVYGFQWRNWNGKPEQITNYGGGEINPYFCDCQERFEDGHSKVRKKNKGIDQISNLIHDLKNNPDSRRLMVNAWNVSEVDQMVLPPCHFGFQCYTSNMSLDERKKWWCDSLGKNISYSDNIDDSILDNNNVPKRKLDLKWFQRSVDSPLGLPFNIASYGILLHLLAKEVNMIPRNLIFNGGDCHIYTNQIEGVKEQLKSETYKLPKIKLKNKSIFDLNFEDIEIIDYDERIKTIKFKLSN